MKNKKELRPSRQKSQRSWTTEEVSYLDSHRNESVQQLSNHLDRSVDSVRNKLTRLGYTQTDPHRLWKKEDVDYLYRCYGRYSVSVLANHLQRTEVAVRHKAESLGLVAYSEYWSLNLLAKAFQVDGRVIHRWHDQFKMPYSVTNHKGKLYYRIKEDEFWKWAIVNRKIVPWKKYICGSLTGEPDNLNQLIAGSKIPANNRKPYTPSEVSKIRSEYYSGQSFKEIAKNNGRTVEAIKHVIERKNVANKKLLSTAD